MSGQIELGPEDWARMQWLEDEYGRAAAEIVAEWISADVGAGGRMNTDVRSVSAVAGPVWSARSMLSRTLELVQIGWCQHEQACSRRGIGCEPSAAIARAWSLDGAINLACAEAVAEVTEFDRFNETGDGPAKRAQCIAERHRLVDALETAIEYVGYPNTELAYYNDDDGLTQEDVVALCEAVLAGLGPSRTGGSIIASVTS